MNLYYMTKYWPITLFITCFIVSCTSRIDQLRNDFKEPPEQYRPVPFLHLNGQLSTDGIRQRLVEAEDLCGFGGVAILPVSPGPYFHDNRMCPGMSPAFLSQEYFERYADFLNISRELGTEIILYDDIDFPSGSAGGKFQAEFPEYTRQFLVKEEMEVKSGGTIVKEITLEEGSTLLAVSSMEMNTRKILDLGEHVKDGVLEWRVPEGDWRIMFFVCRHDTSHPHGHLADYMCPEAVEKFIKMTYDEYDKYFSGFFGNVITKTFFDDVGFVHSENTWTPSISDIFRRKYGKNPALYYPGLFYDIGTETRAARVAFYDIRSELMAENYVRKVSEWSALRGLKSMGHPPENYSPNSVVANGDILKFYRHVHIPLLDAIFYPGRGLHGFKQISSAADLEDKPIVGAELYGAFAADMDSLTMYKVVMEAMARGVNFVVPHGMWYDTDSLNMRIPPLISSDNRLLKGTLPRYSEYVARCCMLLQGGKRVSDIAVLWPIASVQSESYIGRDEHSGLPVANWVPENVVHHRLSDILTNELRRDFTYIHPEDLINGKITIAGSTLVLNNKENLQKFELLIIPGGSVISYEALKMIKQYYDAGGKVLVLGSLPAYSAEFGKDDEVKKMMLGIFGENTIGAGGQKDLTGISATEPLRESKLEDEIAKNDIDLFYYDALNVFDKSIRNVNNRSGEFVLLTNVTAGSIEGALKQLNPVPDVRFDISFSAEKGSGYINYIHKQKDGKDFYFLINTGERDIDGHIVVNGKLEDAEIWNPHTGLIKNIHNGKVSETGDGTVATRLKIQLPAVSSLFIVGSSD